MDSERARSFRSILSDLRERGRRRGDTVTARPGVTWVSVRSRQAGRVFAELRPSREGIQGFLLPPRSELRDPKGLARPAPASQGWGWFKTKFAAREGQEAAALALIVQSLDYARRLPTRGSARKKRGVQGTRKYR